MLASGGEAAALGELGGEGVWTSVAVWTSAAVSTGAVVWTSAAGAARPSEADGASAASAGASDHAPKAAGAARDEVVVLPLRVTRVLADGTVVVDRGTRDGVVPGAVVRLLPKGAPPLLGSAISVAARETVVELDPLGAGSAAVVAGVAGELEVLPAEGADENEGGAGQPSEGGSGAGSGDAGSGADGAGGAQAGASGEPGAERPRPAWERPDDGWTSGEPLLARVRVERPDQRAPVIGGRTYLAAGGASNLAADRGHGFLRGGFDAYVTNPFRSGGRLDLDAELDLGAHFVPGIEGRDGGQGRLRVDALSYSWGGDRWDPEGYTVGRFLMGTTPELGRLDGVEWTRRFAGGDRIGASAGYLVEDGFDGSTGHELAFTGFYRWVPDERELVSVTGAFEKTFYNGDRDRDLVFVRATALPGGGLGPWSLHTALWYDLYDGEDAAAASGANLSRSRVQAWRDWDAAVAGRRDHFGVSLVHEEYVDTKADALDPLFGAGLADERTDRLALDGDVWVAPDRRLFYGAGVWDDVNEDGIDVETGVELVGDRFGDWLGSGERFDVRSFASVGRSSTVLGAGCAYGAGWDEEVAWELAYELMHEDRQGFSAGRDDSLQHRVRYTLGYTGLGAWRLAGHAEVLLQAEDVGLATGFALTRHF